MMSLAKEKRNSTVPLTGRAKTWASRYLTPLMDCLKDHFGNDPEKFLAAHPAYHPTTFPNEVLQRKGNSMLSSIGLKQILCLHEDFTNLNYTLRIIQPISQRSIATEKEINAFIDRSVGILTFS